MKVPIIVPTVFDTSALVKLVVHEQASEKVHAYVGEYLSSFVVTSWTVGEALGVLKRLWLKARLSQAEYCRACGSLLETISDRGWSVENVDLHDHRIFSECTEIAKRRSLDIVDAVQMVAIKHSMLRYFIGESTPILVSADGDLCRAARSEGFRVWNCMDEPIPARFEKEF